MSTYYAPEPFLFVSPFTVTAAPAEYIRYAHFTNDQTQAWGNSPWGTEQGFGPRLGGSCLPCLIRGERVMEVPGMGLLWGYPGSELLVSAPPGWSLEWPRFQRLDLEGLRMGRPLPPAWLPPPQLLAASLAPGIDLALCVVIPVSQSRPHLFGEEKGGFVVPNRGGIHGQGRGGGSLPGTGQAWRRARRE